MEPHATCHLEAWTEQADAARSADVSPACGLLDQFEIALGWQWAQPRDEAGRTRELAVKWLAPGSPDRTLSWGAKLATSVNRVPGQDATRETAWLALLTWQPAAAWTLHANAGQLRGHATPADGNRRLRQTAALALTHAPSESWMAFVETVAEAGGAPLLGTGARWWIREGLALDFTLHRQSGVATDAERYSAGIGLGWYGIRLGL